jgi:hypothetical protein
MNGKIAPISNVRQVKDLHKTLDSLRPYIAESIGEGCGISPFFKAYADRVLKSGHKDNPVLALSGFTWEKGPRKRQGVAEFSVVSRTPEYEGVFLSVKRVVKEELPWNKLHSLGVTREFHAVIADRLKYRTPICSLTNVVLGDTIKTLIGMGKFLISFKVDNGIHLVFKEALRSTRCLEVYIGGWFDETKYPPQVFEAVRRINQLRQEREFSKELDHGPNHFARISSPQVS